MKNSFLIEIKRYARTKMFLVLVAWVIFSAVSSILMIKYLPDLMGEESDSPFIFDENSLTWDRAFTSFLVNNSQVSVFIMVFIAARVGSLNPKSALRDYYYSRISKLTELAYPRATVTFVVMLLTFIFGGLVASVVLQASFTGSSWNLVFATIFIQAISMAMWSVIVVFIALLVNSVGKTFGIFIVFYFSFMLLSLADRINKFSPFATLNPSEILRDKKDILDFSYSFIIQIIILIVLFVVINKKKIR